jgi:hypothetical protein
VHFCVAARNIFGTAKTCMISLCLVILLQSIANLNQAKPRITAPPYAIYKEIFIEYNVSCRIPVQLKKARYGTTISGKYCYEEFRDRPPSL